MKKNLLLIFLLLSSLSIYAQRTLPHPIILVHGLSGDSNTWNEFASYLQNQLRFSVSNYNLNFNLNYDNDNSRSVLRNDVYDYTSPFLGNHDVYIIDFSGGYYSNQSAIVKQGYALKFAIANVLKASKANKVVLLGHSMGGLAIREYLQNLSNWQNDGDHHVAKMITIGTPHGGADLGTWFLNVGYLLGYDERSEAVRDLRSFNPYLAGGYESFSGFFNVDINCNGQTGERIAGLNQKNIYTDLDFACIIGGPYLNDGIVKVESQNMNNHFVNLGAELFYHNCGSDGFLCHTNEPKKAIYQMIQALDEPKKYPTNIQLQNLYKGVFTNQSNGSWIDRDAYSVYCPSKGRLTITANAPPVCDASILVTNYFGNQLGFINVVGSKTHTIDIPSAGTYNLNFNGSSNNGWATYVFNTSFCEIPDKLEINLLGKNTFCEGESVTLVATYGYDTYRWYKNGSQLDFSSNQLIVNQSGNFSVQGLKCDKWESASNSVSTTVYQNPPKPTVSLVGSSGLMSSSPSNNQWYANDIALKDSTNQIIRNIGAGSYKVRVSNFGCYTESDPFVITALSSNNSTLEVKLYPNPNNGAFWLEVPKALKNWSMNVYDLKGASIMSEDYSPFISRTKIEVKPSPGIYILKVVVDNQVYQTKFVID